MSKRLAGKAEEEGEEEETKEADGGQKEAASPLACDPVQATSIPPSKFYTACMYHSLLIHIHIIQQFAHHAQSPSFGITCIPSSLNQGNT